MPQLPKSSPNKLKAFLNWLDDNILLVLGGFLIAFIPLYPKIPVWSPIEQYIVRVRLEDFVLLAAMFVWVIQVLRRKVEWRSKMLWAMIAYEVMALLSTLAGIFITKTIPLEPLHVEKSFLHFFRYIEYFSFFFVLFSAVRKRKDVIVLLTVFVLTVLGVTIYGYGQKYLYWPVYSTMNREFSKGLRLYLGPHARVQSTFGGNYDMSAFLVISLPLLLALAFRVKDIRWKIFFQAAFWGGVWLLILSASRAASVAGLVGFSLSILFTGWVTRETWRKRIGFIVSRGFVIFLITGVLYVSFGEDLQSRLLQAIDKNTTIHNTYHGLNKYRKDLLASIFNPQNANSASMPSPTPPPNSMSLNDALAAGIVNQTDAPPETNIPPDAFNNNVKVPTLVASTSASGAATMVWEDKPRTYSDCALKKSLSECIRLETLWPRAIAGFKTDPLFGSGYATLTKDSVGQFTEAESTDNNFLRTLGETGLLGFVTFYGCVVLLMVTAFKNFGSKDVWKSAVSIGLFGAAAGLLLNAIYIDVFASSKVAEIFWGLSGMLFGYLMLDHDKIKKTSSKPATPTA